MDELTTLIARTRSGDLEAFGEIVDENAIVNPWTRQFVFRTGDGRVLATETTSSAFAAMAGRTPPIRLITAGRIFSSGRSDVPEVSHQVDILCVERGAGALAAAVRPRAYVLNGLSQLRHNRGGGLCSPSPRAEIRAWGEGR
jgi:hypothetical protein